MKNSGLFIISLDFELLWGMRDKRSVQTFDKHILGTRESIPRMLDIFSDYNINATFAIVGFLFAKDKNQILEYSPKIKPTYLDDNLSPYSNYVETIGNDENSDPYHYAPSLINSIKNHPNHEIASHTFSHYYCLENGQNVSDFRSDMQAAINIAKNNDTELKSLIFPRNQYNEAYLKVCEDLGITSYRGNENAWFYKADSGEDDSFLKRVFRMLDTYFNLSGHNSYTLDDLKKSFPINIPSSRFLRPYSKKLKLFDGLRLKRIKKDMTFAAKNNLVFHLWWHPHNFGANADQNFSFLEKILDHYSFLNKKYNFTSCTMEKLASSLINK